MGLQYLTLLLQFRPPPLVLNQRDDRHPVSIRQPFQLLADAGLGLS